jgi:predicted transcriptional regulator
MKPEMKNQLKQLRKEGYGYKKIAKELGLTLSVVRYACNKLNDEDLLEGHCEKCGLKIKSIKGKKRKRFFSDRCRWDLWNKHQKEVDKKAFYTHVC